MSPKKRSKLFSRLSRWKKDGSAQENMSTSSVVSATSSKVDVMPPMVQSDVSQSASESLVFAQSQIASTATEQSSTMISADPHHPPAAPSTQTALPKRPSTQVALTTSTPSEQLWDQAYDDLKIDESKLITAYERFLSSELNESSIEQTNQAMRRSQMSQLVHNGLKKTEKGTKVKQGIGETIKVVVSAKDIISSVLESVPQAALAWAGVCFALQILLNPVAETKANREGIVYIISRMEWYWNLSGLLLQENIVDQGSFEGLRGELEKRIINLYKALLMYQIKSVCSYYRNQGLVFFQDIIRFADWDGSLKSVQDAEIAVQQDSNAYNTQKIRFNQEKILDTAKNQETSLQDIYHVLRDQELSQETKEDCQCLKDLRLTDPRDERTRIEKTKGGLLEDSYHWILQNDDFQQWRNKEHSRLLWITGDPGKGKTMLLIGIIKELQKLQDPNQGKSPLSFFFCQGTDDRLNSATVVLRGLIYLLLDQKPSLISRLRKKYDHAGRALFEDSNAFYYFSEIFKDILHDPCLKGAYVMVDALDECETDLPQLLKFIRHHASASPYVKWIVSSRNRPDIEQYLQLDDMQTRLRLKLNPECISRAVEIYVDFKVSQLASLQNDPVLQGDIQDRMRRKANGTFLWVALVFKELESVHKWNLLKVVDEQPADLEQLYERMIQQIQKLKHDDPKFCRLVLSTATLAYRPLHLLELAVLSGLPSEVSDNIQSVGTIVEMCGSFLTIREESVYFIHQSAKDYLSKNASTAIFPSGPNEIHRDIFSRSIKSMSKTLRKDIYNLRHYGILIDEVQPISPDPLDPLRYSCIYWIDHLCESGSSSSQDFTELRDGEAIYTFIAGKFIYWLEALSLMGSLPHGVHAVIKLKGLLEPQSNGSQLLDLVQDAHRFILYSKGIIGNAPLQTYASALLFSPEGNLIRQLFQKEEPDWFLNKPKIEGSRSACLQTLESHTDAVTLVIYSPDSMQLASASWDRTVRLWDTTTGICLHILKGHIGYVSSAVYSADGTKLASASDEGTVRLWDTATGIRLHILEGHTGHVSSVVYSTDGTHLASASWDHTVRLWDAISGACLNLLQGHADWVNSVVYSVDGKQLASASEDNTVRIWDGISGVCLKVLEGHLDHVGSVVYSVDGKQLASASEDETVRLWDVKTGACLYTLEGHLDKVNLVVYSTDGTQLASASEDGAVRLWDTAAGVCLYTLEGHTGNVTSVVYSPDSMQLASASGDQTVRLWNTETGAYLQTLSGHMHLVNSVVYLADGAQLASASDDGTVRIWDVTNGIYLNTLEGHIGYVTSVVYSADGTQLASASDDETVRLWDASTGVHLRKLGGHESSINSVVYSVEGTQLASALYNGTVRLWDAATGSCLQTLVGHRSSVNSVVYSADGTQLASASKDKTVRIWDAKNGVCLNTLKGHINGVKLVVYSTDGKQLASASYDETVRLWDAVTGVRLHTLECHTEWVNSVVYSADSMQLAAAFYLTVQLWDTTDGICLHILKGHKTWIKSVVYSADCMQLASASEDHTVRIWDTTTGACLQMLDGYKMSSFLSETSLFNRDVDFLYHLRDNASWVVWNDDKILWLPHEYRSEHAMLKKHTYVTVNSGRVIVIRFKEHLNHSISAGNCEDMEL